MSAIIPRDASWGPMHAQNLSHNVDNIPLFFFHFFWEQRYLPLSEGVVLSCSRMHCPGMHCPTYIWKGLGSGPSVSFTSMIALTTVFCFIFPAVCSHSNCSFSSALIFALSINSAECIIHCCLRVSYSQQVKVFEISWKYVFANHILHEQEFIYSGKEFALQSMICPEEMVQCRLEVVLGGLYFIRGGFVFHSLLLFACDSLHRCQSH